MTKGVAQSWELLAPEGDGVARSPRICWIIGAGVDEAGLEQVEAGIRSRQATRGEVLLAGRAIRRLHDR